MGREVSYAEEDSLTQPFRRLNEYLEGIFDLREVDCVMYIMPFHNIIVSEKASGPLTSAALTSLTKFALYGFLSEPYPRVQEGVSLIANCISRCVFEETDWESDELILMKLLELSTLCYRCNASRLLTIASAWEMYNTCISIHNHYKASKILKSEAETALVHLTLSAFGRVVPDGRSSAADSTAHELESLKGRSWESVRENYNMSSETGVTLLLVKILAVLSDTADLQKHSAETVQFALALINVALEAGGPSLSALEPLVEVLSNDVCRHLLRASQSEDLAIVSLALRVVFNLFMSIKNHMKVQLEVFLISVHLRLISMQPAGGSSSPVPSSSSSSGAGGAGGAAQAAIAALAAAKEELALESLLEFCREPSLMNDIYVNYDCDMQCTNLFDSIITTLCRRALPRSLLSETSFAGEKAKTGGPQSPGKSAQAGRAVEAPSPSQIFTYGSSGGLFGLEAPLPPPARVSSTQDTAPRLSIVNRLALDGVLAVLRSVAGQISGCSAPAPRSTEKSAPVAQHEEHTLDPVHHENITFPGEELDQQVDKWCESGSTSPTCEVLSQEEQDAPQVPFSSGSAVHPAVLHRFASGGSVNTEFSSSAGSPHTSRAQGVRSYSAGMNAVDGENEVTTAVQLARIKHAEVGSTIPFLLLIAIRLFCLLWSADIFAW
jgi:hypothetical protein